MNKTFMYVMKRSVHAYRVFQFFNFRHGVSYKKVCGESNDVNEEDCEKWKKEVLPNLLQKYNEWDVTSYVDVSNQYGWFGKT